MDPLAAASTQDATSQVQQAAQIDMLKKANDVSVQNAAMLLGSAAPAPAPAPAPRANPPGIGQLIDRFA